MNGLSLPFTLQPGRSSKPRPRLPARFVRWYILTSVTCFCFLVLALWSVAGFGGRSLWHSRTSSPLGSLQPDDKGTKDADMARQISASDLMARISSHISNETSDSMTNARNGMPKLIHQSWKTSTLTPSMAKWSHACRRLHPSWEWVLWTNEDNLAMVQQFFPWFEEAYRNLPKEINRADACRNMYMFLFGGVYADLDVECVRAVGGLFETRNVMLDRGDYVSEIHIDTVKELGRSDGIRTAFLGRMDYDLTDDTLLHTIPNAWMASTPGHPFWLFVLENLKGQVTRFTDELTDRGTETITGPVALYYDIQAYEALVDKGIDFGEMFAENPSWRLFQSDEHVLPQLEILPPSTIYPFAWNNAGRYYRGICQSTRKHFDSRVCKDAVLTDLSYAISYWSHSWGDGQ